MRILISLALVLLLAGCGGGVEMGIGEAKVPDYSGRWTSAQKGDFDVYRTSTGYLAVFLSGSRPSLALTVRVDGTFTMSGTQTDSRGKITNTTVTGKFFGDTSLSGTWRSTSTGGINFADIGGQFSAFKQRHETGSRL